MRSWKIAMLNACLWLLVAAAIALMVAMPQ